MARYTMELRKVIDYFSREEVEKWFCSYNLHDYLTNEQIEVITFENIWSKEKLAKKIVDHYFMREIGFETPALFAHYAKTTMQEIMEEYLLKIYTKFLHYDPLGTVDYVENFTRNIEQEQSNTGSSNSNSSNNASNSSEVENSTTISSLNLENDTPQTNITKQDLENGAFASKISQLDNNEESSQNASSSSQSTIVDTTSTSNSGNNSTEEIYERKMKGNNAAIITNQDLVQKFRDISVSFDLEIIEKLNTLFMGIY